MSYWGTTVRRHWQRHLPDRYAALDNPDRYFELIDQEAIARYLAIRDSLLDGVSPNNGTTTWPEYLDHVTQADQTAHEIVTHELLGQPSGERPESTYASWVGWGSLPATSARTSAADRAVR